MLYSNFSSALYFTQERVTQSCPTLCDPTDYTLHGVLQARILEWVAIPFSRGSSQPRDRTQVSHIAGGFFTSRATGKPKNTGKGSLSLLQGIFPIQESNQGLLHCRQILYQLSYEGSPKIVTVLDYCFCSYERQRRDGGDRKSHYDIKWRT